MSLSKRDSFNSHLLYARSKEEIAQKTGMAIPGAKRQRNPNTVTEDDEQRAVIQWWSSYSATKQLDYRLLFSIPNGAKLGRDSKSRMIEMARLKATGLRPGVCDLMLAIPCTKYHGLFVEMKSVEGRLSDDQSAFIDLATERGYLTVVCYGASEGIAAIKGYLG